MLERISIDGVCKQVRPDAAVVEQGVALAGCAVAGHRCALARAVDEKLHQVISNGGDRGTESLMPFEIMEAGGRLVRQYFGDLGGGRAGIRIRGRPRPQGAAVRGEFLHVDDGQVRPSPGLVVW